MRPLLASGDSELPGAISKYQLFQEIGAGGVGIVYRGEDSC